MLQEASPVSARPPMKNADSRVMAGIHFRFSCVAGQKLGNKIGNWLVRYNKSLFFGGSCYINKIQNPIVLSVFDKLISHHSKSATALEY